MDTAFSAMAVTVSVDRGVDSRQCQSHVRVAVLVRARQVRTILFSVMVSRKVSISQIEILAVAPTHRNLATGSDLMIEALMGTYAMPVYGTGNASGVAQLPRPPPASFGLNF